MKSTNVESDHKQVMSEKQHIQVDTDKAWARLYKRLSDEGLVVEQEGPVARPFPSTWMKWAATLLLIVTTGTYLYMTLLRPASPDATTVVHNNEGNTLIQVLADGSVVYLAEQASLQMHAHFSETHRTVTLTGEAFFDIDPYHDIPFHIITESATVRVIGTAFNIRSRDKDEFELFVEQGVVRIDITKTGNQGLQAGAGDLVRYDHGTLSVEKGAGLDVSAWKINRMHFKDETLGNILSVINRNYDSNLMLSSSELKNRRMTVTFYNNALPTIVELICLSMNLDKEEKEDQTILLKPKT